jgi:TPR repeat protein
MPTGPRPVLIRVGVKKKKVKRVEKKVKQNKVKKKKMKEQEEKKSVKWWRKAAECGDIDAMNILGNAYEYGWGVKRDYEEAVKWRAKARKKKVEDSSYSKLIGDKLYCIAELFQEVVEIDVCVQRIVHNINTCNKEEYCKSCYYIKGYNNLIPKIGKEINNYITSFSFRYEHELSYWKQPIIIFIYLNLILTLTERFKYYMCYKTPFFSSITSLKGEKVKYCEDILTIFLTNKNPSLYNTKAHKHVFRDFINERRYTMANIFLNLYNTGAHKYYSRDIIEYSYNMFKVAMISLPEYAANTEKFNIPQYLSTINPYLHKKKYNGYCKKKYKTNIDSGLYLIELKSDPYDQGKTCVKVGRSESRLNERIKSYGLKNIKKNLGKYNTSNFVEDELILKTIYNKMDGIQRLGRSEYYIGNNIHKMIDVFNWVGSKN